MLIDWFTVAAQLVNFAVLVLVLRYFLYGRIVRTVEHRDAEIASRLESSERREKEAEERAVELDRREREWDEEHDRRLHLVREEAEERRRQLVEEARREVEELRRRWSDALESDKESFFRDLREGVGRHACEIAREAVAALADEKLEAQVLRVFRERVRELPPERKAELKSAVDASRETPRLVSAFELVEEEREALSKSLGEALDREIELQFETSPDVICGVELVTDGHKVVFSLGSYLSRLEDWAEEALSSKAGGHRGTRELAPSREEHS